MSTLEIKGLVASVAGKQILNGIDLTVHSGEVHAIMGPNGAGKSTLSAVIMGKPGYEVHAGQVLLDGVDLLGLPAWQRAQAGIHLVMQYPSEVPGVGLTDMLSEAFRARGRSTEGLAAEVAAEAQRIGFADRLLDRSLNVDLSGGEKKRNETVQLGVLRPKFAILDEIDSGLDVDALAQVSQRVEEATTEWGLGVIAVTHYNRLLEKLHADVVHIFARGRILESGGPELATQLEESGYAAWVTEADEADGGSGPAAEDPFADPFADPLA